MFSFFSETVEHLTGALGMLNMLLSDHICQRGQTSDPYEEAIPEEPDSYNNLADSSGVGGIVTGTDESAAAGFAH